MEEENKQNVEVEEATSGATTPENSGLSQEFEQIREDINDIKDEKEKAITNALNTAKDDIEKAEKEVFADFVKKQDPPIEAKSEEDLTPEQQEAYEAYKKENLAQKIETIYKTAKNRIINTSKDRLKALNDKQEEAKTFESKLATELAEREEKLAGLDPEKDKEKYEELESEIKEIKEIQGSMDEKIYGTINKATAYQKNFNKNAQEQLAGTFSGYSIDVMGDKDLIATLQNQGKEEHSQKNQENKEDKERENEEPQNEEKEQPEEEVEKAEGQTPVGGPVPVGGQVVGGNVAKGAVAAGLSPEAVSRVANQIAAGQQPVVNTPPTPEEVSQAKYFGMLGYNPDNVLDFASASAVLAKFSGDITDRQRVDMLNNPECKKVIMDSLNIASKNINPFKSRGLNDTRDNVMALINGPLMSMALRDQGYDSIENIKEKFEECTKTYNSQKADLEIQLREAPEEAKGEIEEKLNKLNEEYQSIKNVGDFQEASKKIINLRTRMKFFFKNTIFKKDTYKALGERAGSVANNVKDKASDVAENVKDKAENVVETVKDKTGNAVETVKDKAGNVVETVKEKAADAKEKFNDIMFEKEEVETNEPDFKQKLQSQTSQDKGVNADVDREQAEQQEKQEQEQEVEVEDLDR